MIVEIPTVQAALDLLQRAVDYKGADHVEPLYNDDGEAVIDRAEAGGETVCRYIEPGTRKPGCLIGTALWLAGATVDDLVPHEGEGIGALRGTVYEAPSDVVSLLSEAQHGQDGGKTWGEALEAARQDAARMGARA